MVSVVRLEKEKRRGRGPLCRPARRRKGEESGMSGALASHRSAAVGYTSDIELKKKKKRRLGELH